MKYLLAGFGGQGILFLGKFLAYVGLTQGKEVSWLPSYGPEMRGGTANCSVILSDTRIGSPIVAAPDVLLCMNRPSLDRFEPDIVPGGILIADSTLVGRDAARADIRAYAMPATQLASDNGMPKLANMILLGCLLRETGLCAPDMAERVLGKIIPDGKKDLVGANMTAIRMGYEK